MFYLVLQQCTSRSKRCPLRGGLQTGKEAHMKTEPKLEIAGQTLQCRNEATPVMGRAEHINRQLEAEFWEISARDCRKGK